MFCAFFRIFHAFCMPYNKKKPTFLHKIANSKGKVLVICKKSSTFATTSGKTACIVLKMASFDALILAILNLRNLDIYSQGEATKCAY